MAQNAQLFRPKIEIENGLFHFLKDKSNNYSRLQWYASQKDIHFFSRQKFGIFQYFHIRNYEQNLRVFSIKLNEILDSKK